MRSARVAAVLLCLAGCSGDIAPGDVPRGGGVFDLDGPYRAALVPGRIGDSVGLVATVLERGDDGDAVVCSTTVEQAVVDGRAVPHATHGFGWEYDSDDFVTIGVGFGDPWVVDVELRVDGRSHEVEGIELRAP